jgi:tetratricopeptide (TPR) repeat protein
MSWLESLNQPSEAPGVLQGIMAASLRSALAAERGDYHSAVQGLDSVFARRPVDQTIMSVFGTAPEERYARASWLAAAGRQEEAITWLETMGQGSIYDLALIAPASYRLGELREARGDKAGAREAYRRVLTLYRNADEEFRPLATRAEERLRLLK